MGQELATFRGRLGRSNSQAAFLTFCTFVALSSLALILSTLFPGGAAPVFTPSATSSSSLLSTPSYASTVGTAAAAAGTSASDIITNSAYDLSAPPPPLTQERENWGLGDRAYLITLLSPYAGTTPIST